jgi:hypothetical protein
MFAVVVGAQQYFRDHDTPIRALDPTPIASVATNSQPQRQLIASEVASRASSVPTIPNKMSAPTKQQNKHIGLEDALKENAN